jgi:F0F1-type ATP synthase assembly protein I
MSQTKLKDGINRKKYTLNLALATVAGQVGCVTILIIVVALIAGLWLDNRFNTRPIFLATLLIVSVPVTVIIMLWIVRSVIAHIKPSTDGEKGYSLEEANHGTDPSST